MHGTIIMPATPWPTHGGREVYSHHLLTALDDVGYPMRAILTEPFSTVPASWPLASRVPCDWLEDGRGPSFHAPLGLRDRRWRRYWGWSARRLGALREAINRDRPTFVAAAGLQMLPALAAVPEGIERIWLALDEPSSFQWSIGRSAPSLSDKLRRMKLAATFALYQRTYARAIDMVVAVSQRDADALARIGGFRQVLCLPNGVDASYFTPDDQPPAANTAVFWGRLDFQPNIQALRWFGQHVWPHVVQRTPEARLRIIGRQPDPALEKEMRQLPGIDWIGPVDDVRPWACGSSVVVLPIRSGAGIKNKLLEAAAMARPIVASPQAVTGLDVSGAWRLADQPEQWVEHLACLWDSPQDAQTLGQTARQWVLQNHSWTTNAKRLREHVHQRRVGRSLTVVESRSERRAA
jgi:glycosyltransferase involved in cell wall biosynthesis